jgi:hypothetical protein
VALLPLLLALPARAAPSLLPVGDARVAFDVPAGFADTTSTGSPRFFEVAEALTSASNRILAFIVADSDLRRFTVGDPPELRRYMIAVTPKALEFERTTAASFETFARDSLRSLGKPPVEGEAKKYLETRPPGLLSLLAELRKDPDVVSVLQGVRIPPPSGLAGYFKPSTYALSTTTLILLRGKALQLTVFTSYDSEADLEWIRFTTVRWADDLRKLNR